MDVYLIQHAESKPKEEDPTRLLTERGRAEVEAMGAHLVRLGIRFDRVFHSGKLRAQQTADIVGGSLKISRVEARIGLDPADPVEPIMRWLLEQAELGVKSIAIVGHLPFLDKLVSILVTGSESEGVVAFQYAAVVKLIPKEEGERYRVRWILPPELIMA